MRQTFPFMWRSRTTTRMPFVNLLLIITGYDINWGIHGPCAAPPWCHRSQCLVADVRDGTVVGGCTPCLIQCTPDREIFGR